MPNLKRKGFIASTSRLFSDLMKLLSLVYLHLPTLETPQIHGEQHIHRGPGQLLSD